MEGLTGACLKRRNWFGRLALWALRTRDRGAAACRKPLRRKSGRPMSPPDPMRSTWSRCVRKGERRASRPLAQTLRGGERSSQIERFSLCDVDVDLLHQPRRPKPAARAQANPRGREGKVASLVRTQSIDPLMEVSHDSQLNFRFLATRRCRRNGYGDRRYRWRFGSCPSGSRTTYRRSALRCLGRAGRLCAPESPILRRSKSGSRPPPSPAGKARERPVRRQGRQRQAWARTHIVRRGSGPIRYCPQNAQSRGLGIAPG